MMKGSSAKIIAHKGSSEITVYDEFSTFLQMSTDFYCKLNESGIIIVTNLAFQKSLGYAANELMGKPYIQFIHTNDRKPFQKRLLTNKDFAFTYLGQTKEGEFIQIQSSCTSFTNKEGSRRTLICSQKTSEYQKKKTDTDPLQKELDNYKKELEQFAHLVSHDLKAPLRSITGFLYLIKKRYSNALDAKGIELIQYATQESERMKAMIEGLTEYARVNSHFQEEKMIDMNEVIEKVKEMLVKTLVTSDYDIVLHDSNLPTIKCNQYLITQLWFYLLENALKFSPPKRLKIEISVQSQPDEWLFSIKDDGEGYEEIYIQHIFEPFIKIPGKQKGNSGIELATVKKIVERYGGKVWVEADPPSGTTFFFTIKK